jgi:hypothetical protein
VILSLRTNIQVPAEPLTVSAGAFFWKSAYLTEQPNERLVRLVRSLTQHNPRIFAFIRALVPDRADAEGPAKLPPMDATRRHI